RLALQIDPTDALAHCNLGYVLEQQGRFAEGLAAYKRGHELGSKNPQWPYPSARWVRQVEQVATLEGKLPKLLKGEAQPANAVCQLALAKCVEYKKWYAAATRLYAQAFAAQQGLADNLDTENRYSAACAAALAGSGQGEDAARLDNQERASDIRLWPGCAPT